MSLSAESFPDEPRVQAFLYGPIVLAADLGRQGLSDDLILDKQWPEVSKATPISVPDLRASGNKLEDWIKPDGSAPLAFRAAAASGTLKLQPLSRLWARFATYWNVT